MRKFGFLVISSLGWVLLLALPSLAQEIEEVARLYYIKPKSGMELQFEEAYKQHLDWLGQHGDRREWLTWQIETGERFGQYVVGTFRHRWEDFDARSELEVEERAAFSATVSPYIESVTSSFSLFRGDISRPSYFVAEALFREVLHFRLNIGRESDFYHVQRKIHEAIEKTDWPVGYGWHTLVSGGETPEFTLMLLRRDWADFKRPESSLEEILEKVYGREETSSLLRQLAQSVRHVHSEIWRLRRDLSDIQYGETAGPPPRETGRSFLVGNQKEEEGYGLYSYFLFGSPPTTEAACERYLRFIEMYLQIIPDITALEEYISPNELNVAYLLLKESPATRPSAEWVLEKYNYERARVLLRALPGTHRDGPYIVSTLKPLTGVETLSSKYLYQDLSAVPLDPPGLIVLWVKEFLSQAAQERFWEERTVEQLVLKVRTNIARAAVGWDDVRTSLQAWMVWVRGN